MCSIIDSELGDFYLVIHNLLCHAILADFKGEILSTGMNVNHSLSMI